MSSTTDLLQPLPAPPSSVLLLTPALSRHDSEACVGLMHDSDASATNLLGVTFAQSPGQRMAVWHEHASQCPSEAVILSVGQSDQSSETPEWLTIEGVDCPPSLTQLGVRVSAVLDDWAEEDTRIRFCFRSLTALLQYTDPDTVCQFLDALTDRLSEADAVAHFHVNPGAHDQAVIESLTTHVDVVADADDAGQFRLRRRS